MKDDVIMDFREARQAVQKQPHVRPSGRKGFVSTRADEILAREYPPLQWAVPGYVPEGLSILAGPPKLGKTWLALIFATAVATGGSALGLDQCAEGDVLYLDFENGQRLVKQRLQLVSDVGETNLSRLQFAHEAPNLANGFITHLDEWRLSVLRPALVVVDVLQYIKPPGHAARNAYENDYAALKNLQAWARSHNIAVLLLHHTKKGGVPSDPLESLSGSNGLQACADTTLVLGKQGDHRTLYVRGREVEEKYKSIRIENGRWFIFGDVDDLKRSETRLKILDALLAANGPIRPQEISYATHLEVNNINQMLYKMRLAGEVTKVGRGLYLHPGHGAPREGP